MTLDLRNVTRDSDMEKVNLDRYSTYVKLAIGKDFPNCRELVIRFPQTQKRAEQLCLDLFHLVTHQTVISRLVIDVPIAHFHSERWMKQILGIPWFSWSCIHAKWYFFRRNTFGFSTQSFKVLVGPSGTGKDQTWEFTSLETSKPLHKQFSAYEESDIPHNDIESFSIQGNATYSLDIGILDELAFFSHSLKKLDLLSFALVTCHPDRVSLTQTALSTHYVKFN